MGMGMEVGMSWWLRGFDLLLGIGWCCVVLHVCVVMI